MQEPAPFFVTAEHKENPARGRAGFSKPVRRVSRGGRTFLAESETQFGESTKVPHSGAKKGAAVAGALKAELIHSF